MAEKGGILTMKDTERPYFMENEEWYYHDKDEFCYKLTDKAPQKAIESYKEFYEEDDEE